MNWYCVLSVRPRPDTTPDRRTLSFVITPEDRNGPSLVGGVRDTDPLQECVLTKDGTLRNLLCLTP